MIDASSVEPIQLTAAQSATHEVKTSWHDEARTQRKCEWVVRRGDG